MAGKPKDTIGNALREAIAKCGLSGSQLAKKSGVEQTTLAQFLGGNDMAVSKASKLADYFGLALKPPVKEVEVVIVEVVPAEIVDAKKRKRK